MIYEYVCTQCGNTQDEEHSVEGFKEYRPACNKCRAECVYQFCPTRVQFALKDGPSGSWPSKGERFKKFRAEASAKAAKRQRERYKNPSLVPNFQGKETGTWRDAQTAALQEKGPEAAATYAGKVAKESVSK